MWYLGFWRWGKSITILNEPKFEFDLKQSYIRFYLSLDQILNYGGSLPYESKS